jgi:hypothetical protein
MLLYDIYEVKKTTATVTNIKKKTTYQFLKRKKRTEYNFEYVFHRVDIDFLNSNSNVEFIKNKNQKILIIIITFQTIPREY